MSMDVHTWLMLVVMELFILIVSMGVGVACYDLQDVIDLKQYLFDNSDYDTTIRPIMNQSEIIQLNISLTATSISNFTISSGTMHLLALLILHWTDEQLRWNTSDFGGLNRLVLDSETIWTPILPQMTNVGYSFPTSTTWVYANGSVTMFRAGDLTGRCEIDMRYFPYDIHECNFDLISVIFQSHQLSIKTMSNKVNLDVFNPSGLWDILDTKSYSKPMVDRETGVSADLFGNVIKIRRKPQFAILHVAIPMSLILILNTFVYIVPLKSGERISISVTLLLTMVYFTTDLIDTIPETSDNIALLSMLLVAVNCSSALSVATSVVLCHIVASPNKSIPRVLLWTTRVCRRVQKVSPEVSNRVENISIIPEPDDGVRENDVDVTQSCTSEPDDVAVNEGNVTWDDVAKCVDFILFWFTLVFVIVVCMGFLGIMLRVDSKSFTYD